MIEMMREWLTAVAAVSLLLSIVQMLVPKGLLRETASFIGGLLLLTVLLRPVLDLDVSTLRLDLSSYQEAVEQRQAELEAEQKETLLDLIEAETQAYISDKAEQLGLSLHIRVTAEMDAAGVPIPVQVEIVGRRSDELVQWMETELGIPEERQVWHES